MYSVETMFELFVILCMIFGIILVLLFDPESGCIDANHFKYKVKKIMHIFPIKEKKEPEITDNIA
jgi:hypothetical protein